MVAPDMVHFYYAVVAKKPSQSVRTICLISYSFSHLVDALIYIFFLKDVRRQVWRWRWWWRCTVAEGDKYAHTTEVVTL